MFYTELLELKMVEEWEGDELDGCILQVGGADSTAYIELQEVDKSNEKYHLSYDEIFINDKVDIQIATNNVELWARKLKGKCPLDGPKDRSWGSLYLYLRDPDNLQVILYQEK